MSRSNKSTVWDYFAKIQDTKKALCRLCGEEYSFASTTGNLKTHLKKKHASVFIHFSETREHAKQSNFIDTNKEDEIIYEYIEASPASSASNDDTDIASDQVTSRESRVFSEQKRRISHPTVGGSKQTRLIEHLTEEKIKITSMQKELIEKEMEEKHIKLLILQEEMDHKKQMYDAERKERAHKEDMQQLEKEEMLLRIELLKAKLQNINKEPISENLLKT